MKKVRKKYSNQFKIDAVNLILKQGFNAAEAARNLDINENLLRRWKKEFEGKQQETFLGNNSGGSEQEELKRLRKEVAQLKVEKEILKKAAAFFAKESM
jgi:transposase